MLQITRGLPIYYDLEQQRLFPGTSGSLTLKQIPMQLWITYRGNPPDESGMVVNVTEIKQALSEGLLAAPVQVDSGLVILDWAWQTMSERIQVCSLVKLSLELHEALTISMKREDMGMVYFTTKYELAASHLLRNPKWDDWENQRVFGKCSNPTGHGHNYILEITLRGIPDPASGQITGMDEVDRIVNDTIIQPFDHKNLNADMPEFHDTIPTVENMAIIFWEKLAGQFQNVSLNCIRIWETPKTYAEYFGPT